MSVNNSAKKSDVRLNSPIKGPGLKAPGVVLLQFLLILVIEAVEYSATKVGIFTGIAILLAFGGGLFLGRAGTSFAAVVTPPLALFISTLIVIATVGGVGFSISHIGLDLVTILGAAAPFLVIGAVLSWGYYFISRRKAS